MNAKYISIESIYIQTSKKGKETFVKKLNRKITLTKQRYDTISKGLLAIIYMEQKFRKYTFERKVKLFIDLNAIRWPFTTKDLGAKYSRYILLP